MNEGKPTLGQKITKLIAESKYKNPHRFHKAIIEIAGKDAVSQRHLYNIINDRSSKFREHVLYQIGFVLGLQSYELIKGTTSEPGEMGPTEGRYPYNETSTLYNLYYGLPFKPQMIKMKGFGETPREKDLITNFHCFTFAVATKGDIDLVIEHDGGNVERIKLKLDKGYHFNSEEYHHFENKSKQFSKVLLIRYTKPL